MREIFFIGVAVGVFGVCAIESFGNGDIFWGIFFAAFTIMLCWAGLSKHEKKSKS